MKYEFFYSTKSPFSNFYPSKFEAEGITFISSEQYMMYQKAVFFKDTEIAQKILDKNQTPLAQKFLSGTVSAKWILENTRTDWNDLQSSIKAFGRQVRNYDDTWDLNRVRIVTNGILAKFQQNEDIKKVLLATGSKTLVEAAPHDRIWGIGLAEKDAVLIPEAQWKGKNLLGKVLMDVRSKL
jgi:predicted NAD-dependent protein-ADP-ribosyltransferase YbiA (DUF1768 family)